MSLFLGEDHLRRVLAEWVGHFNGGRPHQGIGQPDPEPAAAAWPRRALQAHRGLPGVGRAPPRLPKGGVGRPHPSRMNEVARTASSTIAAAPPPATRRPQTSGATPRCLNPGFSERIGNSRRTGWPLHLDRARRAHPGESHEVPSCFGITALGPSGWICLMLKICCDLHFWIGIKLLKNKLADSCLQGN